MVLLDDCFCPWTDQNYVTNLDSPEQCPVPVCIGLISLLREPESRGWGDSTTPSLTIVCSAEWGIERLPSSQLTPEIKEASWSQGWSQHWADPTPWRPRKYVESKECLRLKPPSLTIVCSAEWGIAATGVRGKTGGSCFACHRFCPISACSNSGWPPGPHFS